MKKSKQRWAESHIRQRDDGTVIHSQREYVGYGYTEYMIVGSRPGVLNAYDGIKRSYPPQGYGGHYPDPKYLGNDLWIGFPGHSESCD